MVCVRINGLVWFLPTAFSLHHIYWSALTHIYHGVDTTPFLGGSGGDLYCVDTWKKTPTSELVFSLRLRVLIFKFTSTFFSTIVYVQPFWYALLNFASPHFGENYTPIVSYNLLPPVPYIDFNTCCLISLRLFRWKFTHRLPLPFLSVDMSMCICLSISLSISNFTFDTI